MSKPKITRKISQHNFSSRNGTEIKYIVIHDVGAVSTAENNAIYFSKPVKPPVSAHYFIDSTSIYQVIDDKDAAWHCGDGAGKYGITNQNSIGIEMCLTAQKTVAKATVNKTIALVKELQEKYNIPSDRVVRHYDASRKMCPAALSANNWAEWLEFKIQLDHGEAVALKAKYKANELVTVKASATHYQTGEPVAAFVKGGSYTVNQVKTAGDSFAYLLEPIKSWLYEKDLTDAKPASADAKPASAASAGTGDGLKWVTEKAKFTVTVAGGIRVRKDKPSVKAPQSYILKPGRSVNYNRYTQNEGLVWIEIDSGSGGKCYLPVREVGKKAWGKFS